MLILKGRISFSTFLRFHMPENCRLLDRFYIILSTSLPSSFRKIIAVLKKYFYSFLDVQNFENFTACGCLLQVFFSFFCQADVFFVRQSKSKGSNKYAKTYKFHLNDETEKIENCF